MLGWAGSILRPIIGQLTMWKRQKLLPVRKMAVLLVLRCESISGGSLALSHANFGNILSYHSSVFQSTAKNKCVEYLFYHNIFHFWTSVLRIPDIRDVRYYHHIQSIGSYCDFSCSSHPNRFIWQLLSFCARVLFGKYFEMFMLKADRSWINTSITSNHANTDLVCTQGYISLLCINIVKTTKEQRPYHDLTSDDLNNNPRQLTLEAQCCPAQRLCSSNEIE